MAGSLVSESQRILISGPDNQPPTNPTNLVRERRQALASQAGGTIAERAFTQSPLFAKGTGDIGQLVNTIA